MTGGMLDTDVIASRMIKEMFNFRDFGRGSAIAVILLVAVIPVMVANIRRFRQQEFKPMTTLAKPRVKARRENRFEQIMAKAPVHIAVILLALIWTLPTLGLLISSFRPQDDGSEQRLVDGVSASLRVHPIHPGQLSGCDAEPGHGPGLFEQPGNRHSGDDYPHFHRHLCRLRPGLDGVSRSPVAVL